MSNKKLQVAKDQLQQGSLSSALEACLEILLTEPENAKAWHLCGIAHAQSANLEEAAKCFENATRCEPDNANYHFNQGVTYRGLKQLNEAITCYRKAIACRPDFVEAQSNLGNALVDLGDLRDGLDCFRDLVTKHPQSSDVHYNLANLLLETGQVEESIAHYRTAVALNPEFAIARENLGRALSENGHAEEADQVWHDWLAFDPGNAIARHMFAASSGEHVPPRCEDQYICDTFDHSFAKSIDDRLARLQYKGPELVNEALQSLGCNRGAFDVLDAGCGTGLCGAVVKHVSRRLIGVDLSPDMLVEASKRNLYDETHQAEITAYMKSQPQAFDLIVSADTLCYFGELDDVLAAAFCCLRKSGTLIFTVERSTDLADNASYKIQRCGRYCHAEGYVKAALERAGFAIASLSQAILRTELGFPVQGLVVTATA